MKLDKKGFTVIELILSFAFVMFLALGMFALVNNYRARQQKESTKKDLTVLQNTLTEDIYKDTVQRKVDYIRYCQNDKGENINQCINIKFLDGTEKQLKVVKEDKQVTEDGTSFSYSSFYIQYGTIKYENPAPKFAKVVDDVMLNSTVEGDRLEYGVIYRIQIRISHQDLDDEFVVKIITTGLR